MHLFWKIIRQLPEACKTKFTPWTSRTECKSLQLFSEGSLNWNSWVPSHNLQTLSGKLEVYHQTKNQEKTPDAFRDVGINFCEPLGGICLPATGARTEPYSLSFSGILVLRTQQFLPEVYWKLALWQPWYGLHQEHQWPQRLLVSLSWGKTKISCSVGGVGMFSCCFARKNFNPDWMKLAILSEGLSTNRCLLAKINCTDQKSSCGCISLLQCFSGALDLKNKVNFLIFMPL